VIRLLPRAALPLAALLLLPGCAPRLAPAAAATLLDALFAPPTAAEVAAVEAEWARRDTGAHGYRVEWERREPNGRRTLVLSHTVGGVRHYGMVRVPPGGEGRRLPVLVVAHGGDRGATRWQFFREGPLAAEWVQVVPSFRSERLIAAPFRWYRSGGTPSPWDRDVDDTMALLSTVLAHVPEADSARVAVLGRSRGAGVGLLMAARDPRVKAVVDFSGPTDFFLPEVRRLAERAMRLRIARLPGAGYMADSVLFPLRDGRLPLARARLEFLRRSPARFAHRLPPVQAHHGTGDGEVPVAHGDRLAEALRRLGREAPTWEYHRYPGGGHRPRSLPGSQARTEAFLRRVAEIPSSPLPQPR
jgi:dipeptidyl aminopeptidase/acylaminoacyl peptidase